MIPLVMGRSKPQPPAHRFGRFMILLGWIIGGCHMQATPRPKFMTQPWVGDGMSGRRLVSDHFEIISTLEDREFEAALPAFVEEAYARYVETLPPPPPPGDHPRQTMYVFHSRPQWERFTRRNYPVGGEVYSRIRSGGFTESDTSVSFHMDRSATLATLAHEGWHQYVNTRVPEGMPAWLNEGLACYHEALEFGGPRPRFTPLRNTLRINKLREAVQRDALLPLVDLLRTDAGEVLRSDDGRLTQTYYAQAWALVTFLRHGAQGRYAADFKRLLHDVSDGTIRARVGAARLGDPDAADTGYGEAVFRVYFHAHPKEVEEEYYGHLVKLAGL